MDLVAPPLRINPLHADETRKSRKDQKIPKGALKFFFLQFLFRTKPATTLHIYKAEINNNKVSLRFAFVKDLRSLKQGKQVDSRYDGRGVKDGSAGGTFKICSHCQSLTSRLVVLCEVHFKP